MSYGELLHSLPQDLRKYYRNLESTNKKLINLKWSKVYSQSCLSENILPKYSRIRHEDPAIPSTDATTKYRRYLVEQELSRKEQQMEKLHQTRDRLLLEIENFNVSCESKASVTSALNVILQNSDEIGKTRILKKLNSVYHGNFGNSKEKSLCIKENVDNFVNLSNYVLSASEKEFLNLGLNCHIQPKYDKIHKQVELETLYQNLLNLESKKKVTIKPELSDRLRSEGTKHRHQKFKSILTPSLKEAAKSLKTNAEIVIRKADKSSQYVIMNKDEYITKLNEILSDGSKFERITRNPIENLKKEANALIETQNAVQDDIKIPKIIGDYKPGYVYGNVKTHKTGNPLRPIISQIPTPTYNLAKTLNQIIVPYMPNQYTLKSSSDFIDLLRTNSCNGIIASLDVESLFTNVPIDATIEIIIQETYHNPSLPPPKMPKEILKRLLELCTKKAPFKCPEGKLYVQIEGVAMGSPLGPTFANYYMGHLENVVFKNQMNKPKIYARYMDDIFVEVKDETEIIKLKELFERHSVLNFTYEMNVNQKLPFLDVLVDASDNCFKTTVYHKPTDLGLCLNGLSECTEKYKLSCINNYINRAYKISDNWEAFHEELKIIKQRLINNNYSNQMIDSQINKFLEKKQMGDSNKQNKTSVKIFYASQMHPNYKIEEKSIKSIIYNNVKCLNEEEKLDLVFYYKNIKTSSFVMKNNAAPPLGQLEQTNVIYKFSCPMSHSQATEYIGFCQTTLSQRLVSHRQNGSIREHFEKCHNIKPTRDQLINNTEIIARANDRQRLAIKEALLILKEKPIINKQFDNFGNILKLYNAKNITPQNHYNARPNSAQNNPHSVPDQSLIVDCISNPSPLPTLDLANSVPDQNLIVDCNSNPSPHPPSDPSQTISISSNTDQDFVSSPPMYPIFSQRILRLLTSPINLNYVDPTYSNSSHTPYSQVKLAEIRETPTLTTTKIPDMTTVLRRFGINPDTLREVDISEYQWDKFTTAYEELTISQRIRSLRRHCENQS